MQMRIVCRTAAALICDRGVPPGLSQTLTFFDRRTRCSCAAAAPHLAVASVFLPRKAMPRQKATSR